MQTFLPSRSFKESAFILDNKRLNKQRVECKQIYLALTDPSYGWKHHPAVKMWKGYEQMLCIYAIYMCTECDRREIADNVGMKEWFNERMLRHPYKVPAWMLDSGLFDSLVLSHQSNLVRKDEKHYAPFFPSLDGSLPYIWPV